MSDHNIYKLSLKRSYSTYVFKTEFKIDGKFNPQGIKNNGIWNHTAKVYWEN